MFALLLLAGCLTNVRIESLPQGAAVTLPSGQVVTTPAEVPMKWVPFGHQVISASKSGYRTTRLDLRSHCITWTHLMGEAFVHRGVTGGKAAKERVVVMLVADHGPTGSWDPVTEGLEK